MTDSSLPVLLDEVNDRDNFISIFVACEKYIEETRGAYEMSDLKELLKCKDNATVYKARGAKGFSISQHLKWTKRMVEAIKVDVFQTADGDYEIKPQAQNQLVPNDSHRHYIYYFSAFSGSGELKFYRAYLFMDLKEETAILEHHPDPSRKASHRSRYDGKFEYSEDKIFLTLNKVNASSGIPGKQMAFNTINANLDQLYQRSPFLVSTYITFHPDAGVAVLELVKDRKEVNQKIKTEKIPDHIAFILYNRRFEVNRAHRNLLDLQNINSKLGDLTGLHSHYQGFVIYDRFGGAAEIVGSVFKIYDTFRISFKSPNRPKPVHGYIVSASGGVLQCRMHYTRGSHHHRSAINLKRNYSRDRAKVDIPSGTLAGNYNMLSPGGDIPISGRLILYPMTDPAIPPKDFVVSLKDTKKVEGLQKTFPTLLPFLSGAYDEFADSPLQHEEPVLRRLANQPRRGEKLDPTLRSYSGLYYSLRVSSRHKAVYMRPVVLDGRNGEAKRIIFADKTGRKTELSGNVWLIDGQKICLQFTLQEKVYQDNERSPSQIQRQTVLTIEKGQDYRGRVLEGVTTRVNKDGLPISFREFFFWVREEDEIKEEALIMDFRSTKFKKPFEGFPSHVVKKMLEERESYLLIGEKSDKRHSWLLPIDD